MWKNFKKFLKPVPEQITEIGTSKDEGVKFFSISDWKKLPVLYFHSQRCGFLGLIKLSKSMFNSSSRCGCSRAFISALVGPKSLIFELSMSILLNGRVNLIFQKLIRKYHILDKIVKISDRNPPISPCSWLLRYF